MTTPTTPIEVGFVQWHASKRTHFTAPPATGSTRVIRALDAACDWTVDRLHWFAVAAIAIAVGIAANVYGADEIRLEQDVQQEIADRAAESRYLAAEAAMERDLQVATAAGR